VEKRDGTIIDGYFMGMDRSTAAIHLSAPYSTRVSIRSIGVPGLKRFEKFRIDRLGNRHAVPRETRTWHGVICTWPSQRLALADGQILIGGMMGKFACPE